MQSSAVTDPSPGRRAGHIPGEAGIWMFIFGDMMVFSLFFVIFLWYRAEQVDVFTSSQTHLNQRLGVLNTFFMLTSSWFVASAVQASRRNQARLTSVLFGFGFLCGLGFVVVKYFEWSEKIHAGITLTTNDFFTYYFVYTGIHFMHVMIGMGVLAYMARYALAHDLDANRIRNIESGASFWHVVDLLWILLFALLYLVK